MEHPVHDLRDRLQAARLKALEGLAATAPGTDLWSERLRSVGEWQLALLAIQDELNIHETKVGYGGEQPLA